MNSSESTLWLADLIVRLPSCGRWCAENRDTMQLWCEELFADLQLEDCVEVNRLLMHEGFDCKLWEMDSFGARVRRMARQLDYQRRERRERGRRPPPPMRGEAGSMVAAFAAALRATTPEERRAAIEDLTP